MLYGNVVTGIVKEPIRRISTRVSLLTDQSFLAHFSPSAEEVTIEKRQEDVKGSVD
jgi:hypothetical protein